MQASDRSLLIDVTPPDLQPAANAWASRMFGIGAVLGYYVGGIDLVYFTGGYLGGEQLKVLTFFTAILMCACHAVTVFFVKERVLISREDDAVFEAGGSSTKKALMDIWITFRTLPRPIQHVLDVQVKFSLLLSKPSCAILINSIMYSSPAGSDGSPFSSSPLPG